MALDLSLPKSPLVLAANQAVKRLLGETMHAHSLRTFFLARAYARAKGLDFNEEALSVAALFHDVGLAKGKRNPGEPFTAASSRALSAFLEEQKASLGLEEGALSIAFHMQPIPRWDKGQLAGLLQVGAWMDAMGLRRGGVREEARAIEQAFPRGDFDSALRKALLGSIDGPRTAFRLFFPKI